MSCRLDCFNLASFYLLFSFLLFSSRNILVVDIGGSSLSATVFLMDYGVYEIFHFKRWIDGPAGSNFTQRIVDHILPIFEEQTGIKLDMNKSDNKKYTAGILQQLYQAAERVKRYTTRSVRISFDYTTLEGNENGEEKTFLYTFPRNLIEEWNFDLLQLVAYRIGQVFPPLYRFLLSNW